jgi:hypothetical protein
MTEIKDKVLAHVLSQVRRDSAALESLSDINWLARVEKSVHSFVPDLVIMACELMEEVRLTLKSPRIIREAWQRLEGHIQNSDAPAEVKREAAFLNVELGRESKLLTQITGDIVSNVISDFLCNKRRDISKNNRSTYPDLYFKWADYSMLPQRQSGNATGPALKGNKPTSVPDGVEIKSQRGNRIRVDCHHPHMGMHLVLTYKRAGNEWLVYDVFIAYLSRDDYRQATRNTTATTEKFSFKHAPFISATTGATEVMESAETDDELDTA